MADLTTVPLMGTSQLHDRLLGGARRIGGIYHLDFQNAQVSTDDKWKADAGGVPQHSFLLATVMPLDAPSSPEDEEILLLRVDDTCMLPRQAELIEVREFAMRQMLTGTDTIIDVLTQQEMQRSGLKCRILGTFYQTDLPNGQSILDFGADIDNLYSASRYRVYKPSPGALATIASYPQLTEDEARKGIHPDLLTIGSVRYSSTLRRARTHGEHLVPVEVRVGDFIEMKTAVFGMTRMGKSNTIKTLATATFRHAKRINEPIGQLLFDPQGEYANPNVQDDGIALSDLGPDVVIYRFGADPVNIPEDRNVEPLQINFYDEKQLEAAQEVIGSVLAAATTGNYVTNFINAELTVPATANFSRKNRASRARFCFYALLGRAGFTCPEGHVFTTSMKRELVEAMNNDQNFRFTVTIPKSGHAQVQGVTAAQAVVDWLLDQRDSRNADAIDWLTDQSIDAIVPVYQPTGVQQGWRWVRRAAPFHNVAARSDYSVRVHQDLVKGFLVIVDLSRGTEQVLQLLSERIINHIIGKATERFTENKSAHRMQIVIEEAHRLFDRKSYDADAPNPYVRLAKEAAKFKIGLIYATQEVTAVHPAILANTSNWIVAHLNNTQEINALSRYYDFKAFEQAILSAEDRGFVRLKTRSGKYIVPAQIALFDRKMINEARRDVGLPELPPATLDPAALFEIRE
ncbi:DUF87 domain-containing protein [Streptosporangium subroseum]|uniref:helicase HerA domain-containing protein n=1 Tax=Streptosporangium subroseum TaxID=106412 RepID=UPI00342340BA